MYAVIGLSGKQYLVREGDLIESFKIGKKEGEAFTITDIRLLGKDDDTVITDAESLSHYEVSAQILQEKKGKKVYSFKKKAKTGYSRGVGHRDQIAVIKIEKIIEK
ncbi:MAG: 50S ribosomal protein L21 [Candidatus Ratteibacteria bacterium]|jgi:large subunit ribosomal protein L21